MADISKVTLPNDASYDIKDANAIHSVNITQTAVSSETTKEIAKIEVDESKTSIYADDADKILRAAFGEHTVTGNPVSADAFLGLEVPSECKVTMNPIQDLHGYDHPWAGGAGKNKLDSVVDVINATPSDTNAVDLGTFTAKANTYYTVSCMQHSALTSSERNTFIVNYDGTNHYEGYENWHNSAGFHEYTFSVATEQEVSVKFWAHTVSNNCKYDDFMVEIGQSATSFAPYSNICPISGRTEASVTRTGKNLTSASEFNAYKQSDGSYYGKLSDLSNIRIYVDNTLVGKQVTFSAYLKPESGATNNRVRVYVNGNFINGNGISGGSEGYSSVTFTPTSADEYVGITYGSGGNINCNISNIQLEISSARTAYEPYTAETHTHQYGQTVYGGVDDFVNGEGKSEYHSRNCDGTEDWQTNGSSGVYIRPTVLSPNAKSKGNALMSIYTKVSDGEAPPNGCWNWNSAGTAIQIRDERAMTASAFKTLIATDNNLQMCYELATPTTIETSAEEITLLKGNNVLSTDGDNLELKYSADIKAYIDKKLEELS